MQFEKLLESGKAYKCFCSKEKISEERLQAEKSGGAYLYSGTCRNLDVHLIQENIKNKTTLLRSYFCTGWLYGI